MISHHQCFECGKPAKHAHHVVPKSFGGTRTVPLCMICHSKVHQVDLTLRGLQLAGIEVAKAAGTYKGRKPGAMAGGADAGKPARARELRSKGNTAPEIARALGVSVRSVWNYLGTD
jgi:hypothetical protein